MLRAVLIAALLCCIPAQAQEVASQGLVETIDFSFSGNIDMCGHDAGTLCPTFWIDFAQDPSGATITSNSGHVLTKVGAPARVLDGLYPDGIDAGPTGYAHSFDGMNDYYSRADDGTFDPAGDFSFCFAFTPDGDDGVILGKAGAAGSIGWHVMYDSGNSRVVIFVSDDGTNTTLDASANNSITTGRMSFICVAFDSSETTSTIYVDGLAVETNASMRLPVANVAAPLEIGVNNSGLLLRARTHHIWYYDGLVLTEADHDRMATQYRGLRASSGKYVEVTTATPPMVQVATPASGVEPLFRPMPANTSQIGPWGIAGTSARTSLVQRGTLETCAAGNFTGWSKNETPGAGSAAITCETGTMTDGATSAKIALTGTDSSGTLTSTCVTTGIGADLYVQVMAIGTELDIAIEEFDAADCTSSLQVDAIGTDVDTSGVWDRIDGLVATADWHADTSSWRLYALETCDGGCTSRVDSAEAYAGSEPRPGLCASDTSASTICTASLPAITGSPISIDGSMTMRFTARSDWAGTELAADKNLVADGTATNANTILYAVLASSDEPYLAIYDATPAVLAITSAVANWSASTDYDLQFDRNGLGGMGLFWNAAWNDTTAGAGTGHRAAKQSTLTLSGDAYFKDLEWFRRRMR